MAMLIVAYHEIVRMLRNRSTLVMFLLLPLLIIFILGSALGPIFGNLDRKVEPVKLVLYAADSGPLVAQAHLALSAAAFSEMLHIKDAVSRDELMRMLREGTADYGAEIPAGFSAKVAAGELTNWVLYPGTSTEKNLTAEITLRGLLDGWNNSRAAAVVLGPVAEKTIDAKNSSTVAGNAETANPLVEIGKLNEQSAAASAMQYYSAAMLVMFLLMAGVSAGISLSVERENHTLERLYSLPISAASIVMGKLMGRAVFSMLQALIIILFTGIIYDVNWGVNYGYLFLVCLLTILSSLSIALFLALIIRTSRNLDLFFSITVYAMTFISGGMAPNLGPFVQKIARFTVNQWAAGSLIRIMLRFDHADITSYVGVLALISLGLFAVAIIGYRKAGYYA
ncbi:MAG: ABC transporter permease [Gorillibacterium sp.]|nr:ABC transporter permease [Gorillibacterium sp.]